MSRIISIDYGVKKTGLAITDPEQIIASPLDVVETKYLIDYLAKLFNQYRINDIVVGFPIGIRGNKTDQTSIVEKFIIKITQKFPTKTIHKIDERFTSKISHDVIIKSDIKKSKRRKNASDIDMISAALILQSYLKRIYKS